MQVERSALFPLDESQVKVKYSVALGCTLKLVILKFTGIAPLIVPVTVKVVDPTFTLFTVAVTCMLLDVLLAVTPMRVTEVVVVMVIVDRILHAGTPAAAPATPTRAPGSNLPAGIPLGALSTQAGP